MNHARRPRKCIPAPVTPRFIVRHCTACYVVLDTHSLNRHGHAVQMECYDYDPAAFETRRAAWRDALDDAEVRNAALNAQEVTA